MNNDACAYLPVRLHKSRPFGCQTISRKLWYKFPCYATMFNCIYCFAEQTAWLIRRTLPIATVLLYERSRTAVRRCHCFYNINISMQLVLH